MKDNDLDVVLSKIKKLESNHVYSVQSMKAELKEKEVGEQVTEESSVSEKSQSLINQYFKRTKISTCTQKEKYSSKKSIDLVQTDLGKFCYKKSTYTYEYHQRLMEADLKGCFEINPGSDDVWSSSQDDLYLDKAAESIELNAKLLEMDCQDEAALLEAMKEIENHNSDEIENHNSDESENDLFLYEESVRLEELDRSNVIEAQAIMKSLNE